MCALKPRLDRIEAEKEQLRVQVDELVQELKTEREQREVLEGKLAQVENTRVLRDAIPASNGVRPGASAMSGPDPEAGKRDEDWAATQEKDGGHESAGHPEGYSSVVEDGKGSLPGKSYAQKVSEEPQVSRPGACSVT